MLDFRLDDLWFTLPPNRGNKVLGLCGICVISREHSNTIARSTEFAIAAEKSVKTQQGALCQNKVGFPAPQQRELLAYFVIRKLGQAFDASLA